MDPDRFQLNTSANIVLRPSVLGQDRSDTIKIGFGLGLARCGLGLVHCGLGLAGLLLRCERKSILSRSS